MLNRSIQITSKSRLSVRAVSQLTSKRYNHHSSNNHSDHGHHGTAAEDKPFEITITKIFGIAALAGGLLMYKRKDTSETPLFESGLFEQEQNGERSHLRDKNFENRYKIGFIKTYINDNGGEFGDQIYRRSKGEDVLNNNLLAASSPYGNRFGAGIKLNELGPRRERIPRFAPLTENNE
ncbi:hypothetical protein KGF56_004488 [Candida oxycetoniae]|uniref:Uncharacterized protein n=1 Tax=Candida oxycetoniae TaxID=497107 RepID=A0AAI9WWJ7_9ASCO|nr:uncharacterized protein KGF56_004488 [Candida oxycetoniae]KAI3402814.2 hypothetical protein KGF56_004488 [Candida oxycetoniae]